jgi:hypothetical protein
MKVTINKERFNEIIKEEVEKYRKIKELENDKKQIEEALVKLQETTSQEEIDELWGGLKNVFKKGAQVTGNAVQNAYQGAKNDVNQFANAVGQKAQAVGQAVQKQAQQVKQVYQQGEKEQAIKTTKSQIQKLWAQRQQIQSQLNAMQAKYAELTGKKLGNQFQAKNPQIQPGKAAE